MNDYNRTFIQLKKENRERKREKKRFATGEEVIYIFEKVLENWSTIKIYNSIIQNNPNTNIDKKHTENIATGNCKLSEKELSEDRFKYYTELRERVYKYNNKR